MKNLGAILAEAGSSFDKVVKTTILLVRRATYLNISNSACSNGLRLLRTLALPGSCNGLAEKARPLVLQGRLLAR